MGGVGPVLVYSSYDFDLERFRRILSAALPDLTVNYAGSQAAARPFLADAEILYGWGFSGELLRSMRKLRWVQKMGAGVDDIVNVWPFRGEVLLTRTDGRLIAPRMVEYVIAAILDKSLKLDHARKLRAERRWSYFEMGSIRQLTVGVAGLGQIGVEIARALRVLGTHVVGWRRSHAAADGVSQQFVGDGALADFVGPCDVVVLALPLTADTRHVVNADLLRSFKQGAHLINVGRGGLVDERALLAAIDSGRIGHATLDVFETEPLPSDHPFWAQPAITMTPHVCGPLIPEEVAPHFIDNLAAFASGRPLRNVVDLDRQY